MISYDQYLQFSPYFAQEDIEKEEDRLRFLKLFDALPQAVRDLLSSMDTAEKIFGIGRTFGLDEFDTEALSFAVRKLATGEVPIVQGIEFIITEAELPEEKASDLLNSIINNILTPVTGGQRNQPARPPQRTPVNPVPHNLSPPEPTQTTDPRVIDLRNRQN